MTGRSLMTALSLFAFMLLGSATASAQYVNSTEAIQLIKAEILTLDNDFAQATTDAQKVQITFEKRYYLLIGHYIAQDGLEVPAAIEEARPTDKPALHSSGLVYFTSEGSTFKSDVTNLVSEATDLLSE